MKKIIMVYICFLVSFLLVGCASSRVTTAKALISNHLESESVSCTIPYTKNGNDGCFKIDNYIIGRCYLEKICDFTQLTKTNSKEIASFKNSSGFKSEVAVITSKYEQSELTVYICIDGTIYIDVDKKIYMSSKDAISYYDLFEVVNFSDANFGREFENYDHYYIRTREFDKEVDKYASKGSLKHWMYWKKVVDTLGSIDIPLLKLPYLSFIDGEYRQVLYSYLYKDFLEDTNNSYDVTSGFGLVSTRHELLLLAYEYGDVYYSGYDESNYLSDLCDTFLMLLKGKDESINNQVDILWDEYCQKNS